MKKLKKIMLVFALLLLIVPCTAIFAACGNSQPQTYTVTFVDWNDAVIDSQTIKSGEDATVPTDPTRVGHTFAGWDIDFSDVTANITVKATYDINTYTVTFVDHNGTVLSTKTVNYGASATAPSNPTRQGYNFISWSGTYTNVTSNLTITAVYEEKGPEIYSLKETTDNKGNVQEGNLSIYPDNTFDMSFSRNEGTTTYQYVFTGTLNIVNNVNRFNVTSYTSEVKVSSERTEYNEYEGGKNCLTAMIKDGVADFFDMSFAVDNNKNFITLMRTAGQMTFVNEAIEGNIIFIGGMYRYFGFDFDFWSNTSINESPSEKDIEDFFKSGDDMFDIMVFLKDKEEPLTYDHNNVEYSNIVIAEDGKSASLKATFRLPGKIKDTEINLTILFSENDPIEELMTPQTTLFLEINGGVGAIDEEGSPVDGTILLSKEGSIMTTPYKSLEQFLEMTSGFSIGILNTDNHGDLQEKIDSGDVIISGWPEEGFVGRATMTVTYIYEKEGKFVKAQGILILNFEAEDPILGEWVFEGVYEDSECTTPIVDGSSNIRSLTFGADSLAIVLSGEGTVSNPAWSVYEGQYTITYEVSEGEPFNMTGSIMNIGGEEFLSIHDSVQGFHLKFTRVVVD